MRITRDASFLIFLLFVFVFATCAESQTVSSSQIVIRCVSASRLATAGPPSETIIYRDCDDGKTYISRAGVSGGAFSELTTGGTVTSVGIAVPAHMSVSGSPVTTSGTITLGLQSQTQNLIWASPNGSSGTPIFRALVANDLPATMNATTFPSITLSDNATTITHSGTTSFGLNTAGPEIRFHRFSASGADFNVYSPNTATIDFGVDGATGNVSTRGKFFGANTGAAISSASAGEFLGSKVTNSQVVAVIDNTAMTTGVGGGVSMYGQYTAAGAYRPLAAITASKEAATDAVSTSSIVFWVNSNAASVTEAARFTGLRNLGLGTATPETLSTGAALTGRILTVFTSTSVARLALDGSSSVTIEAVDSGFATANQKALQILWNDAVLSFLGKNDSGTTRVTGGTWNSATNTWAFTNISVSGTCTGCSGTGDSNSVGTWASRPAGGVNAGNTYQSTDAPYMQIDDGAALVYFGPRYQFFLPVLGDFTWVNQGTATADQTNGAVWMQGPGTGTGTLRALVKTAPATPYTITIAVQTQFLADIQYAGFAWRESSSGKLVACYYVQQAGLAGFYAANWTDASTFSADIAATTEPDSVYNTNRAGVNWIKAVDDGTNRKCSWSVDGVHFYEWYSAGRTTHMTANQVGFAVGNQTSGSTVQMNLYSWLQQ